MDTSLHIPVGLAVLAMAAAGGAAMASATNGLIRYLPMAESPLTTAAAWTPAEIAKLKPRDYFS